MGELPLLALSVRQPWANFIAWGLKDIEIRTWVTKYRGLLLIHAGTTLDRSGLSQFPIEDIPTGVILGSVKLVDIVRFTRKTWKEWGDRHLDTGRLPMEIEPPGVYRPSVYAWMLENHRPFAEPIPYKGALKLFRVDSEEVRRALSASQTQR